MSLRDNAPGLLPGSPSWHGESVGGIVVAPMLGHAARLVVERHGYGLEYQLPIGVAVALLHQFAAIEGTVVGHEEEVVGTAQPAQGAPYREAHACGVAQPGVDDERVAPLHETVYRREAHALVYRLKGKHALAVAMHYGHMVDGATLNSFGHCGDVVAALAHTEQKVALGQRKSLCRHADGAHDTDPK